VSVPLVYAISSISEGVNANKFCAIFRRSEAQGHFSVKHFG